MKKYIVLHSTNLRDTLFFDAEGDIFNADAARKAVKTYKALPPRTEGLLYEFAGVVDAEGLDGVFRKTNHVDGTEDWDARSTSVGDVILGIDPETYEWLEDETFVVDRFGFCQLMGA